MFSSDTLAAGNPLVINASRRKPDLHTGLHLHPSSTFASMPNLTNLPTTTFKSCSSSTTLQVSQSNVETKKIPIDTIIGGVLGGILFFVLIGFFLRLAYLRKKRGHGANRECPLVLVIVRYR